MSTPQLILWIVALVVAISSAWRNWTASALVLAFMASEAGLPLEYYPWSDVLVIAIIMMKLERSPADRFIIFTFPLAWLSYIFDVPYSNPQWWHLFWVAILQFFAVGADATHAFFRARSSIVERHLGGYSDSFFAAFSGVHPVFLPRAAECAFISATGGGGDG